MNGSRVTWRKSRASLIFFIAILVLFLGLTFRLIMPYVIPVLMGSIIALLAHPLYRRLRAAGQGPKLASGLVTLAVTILVVVPLVLFIVMAVKQAIAVGQSIAGDGGLSLSGILGRITRLPLVRSVAPDPVVLQNQLRGTLETGVKGASGALLGAAGNIPALGLAGALTMLTCFFMLIDGRRFVNWLMQKLPLDQDVQRGMISTFQNTSISVIWATLAAAGAQAAVMFVAYLALGVPGAFLAAGATFIFAWIPMVGSAPVWAVGAIYLFMQGSIIKAVAMIAFGVFTSLVDNVIRPLVLKGRGEMHPLVSLVAIFGGIEWFGIVGVFLGPILASVVIALLEIWPTVAQRSHLALVSDGEPGQGPARARGSGTDPDAGPGGGGGASRIRPIR